jgi:hypothetical protein
VWTCFSKCYIIGRPNGFQSNVGFGVGISKAMGEMGVSWLIMSIYMLQLYTEEKVAKTDFGSKESLSPLL